MSRFVVLRRFVRHRVATGTRYAALCIALLLSGVSFVESTNAQLQESAGNVRVNVEWDEYIDIDLYVTDPCGNILGYGKLYPSTCKTFSGVRYFEDGGYSLPNAESIVWKNRAPVGNYKIHVNYYRDYRGSPGSGAVKYTVRVFLGDREQATYTYRGQIAFTELNYWDGSGKPLEGGWKYVGEFEATNRVVLPTISIAPGPAIEEGGTATFTLTAVPAPAKSLSVAVTIDQTGNFVRSGGTGEKTVTIDTTGSGTLDIETVDDAANDTDGSITVSVLNGDGYTGKPSASVPVKIKKVDESISIAPISDTTGTVGKEFKVDVDVTIGGAGLPPRLVFYAESSDSSIASVSPTDSQDWSSGSHVTVTPRKAGTATITVTAADDDGSLKTTQQFLVTVKPATSSKEEEEAIQETVAAVAATTVSNVTSNIGARFSAPSTGSFSAPGTGGVLVRLAGMPVVLGSDDRNDPGSVSLADRVDAFGGDPWQPRQRTMSVDELLRTSSFEVTLGAAEGESGDAPGAGSGITVWGRGDLQFFESGGGRKSGYDGHLVAGYLGADIAMDGGWLAGVAVSRIAAEADYTLAGDGEGGSLEADLTNIHPYVRVAVDDRNEAWAIFGLGRGKLTDAPDGNGQEKSKSDLSMRMASAGLRHRLATDMGIDLALLGDGSFATIETDDGLQSVAGISSDVWRARLGVEASHTSVWESGSSLTSFLEVAGRRDGGDATEGWGLEVSPGLSFSDPGSGLSVEARIRALALHSVEDHDEYGASLTASLTPDADGLGLSMAVTPTWGAPETALGEADANLFGRPAADRGRDALSLNSRVAYGLAAGRGVVSPFAELSLHRNDSQQMRIGSRYSLGSAVDLELFGARSGHGSGDPEHSVGLTSRVHF